MDAQAESSNVVSITAPREPELRYGIRTPGQLVARIRETGKEQFLVDGLLRKSSLAFLIGDSGLGKSPLLYQLASCIAAEVPFLGRAVHPINGTVLYCDAEDGIAEVDRILNQISKCLGRNEPPEKLRLWNLNDAPPEGNLEDLVRETKPDLAILDPIVAFLPNIEGNNSDANADLHRLRSMIAEHKCAFVGVHHIRKTSRDQKVPPLETANLREWFQETRGPRVLINGIDLRLGIDETAETRNSEVVIRGFARVTGEIPPIHLQRVRDDDGEPVGYKELTGVEFLGDDQRKAYESLPIEFTTKEAMGAYGRKDQATDDFLKRCIAYQLLRKTDRGRYRKTQPAASDLAAAA